jgi:AraC-like DNA-binding protein
VKTVTDKIEAVQKMQYFIENHVSDEISLTDLAEEAHFSPWYSARIFKELTGLSPADYIRRSKLSKSALRLRDENPKITDIAFDMGFASVDGYQRAFRREFGCNPKEYAKKPVPIPLFIPYGVKFKYLWKKENPAVSNIRNVFIMAIDKPARKVIIKRGNTASDYMEYCQEVGCDVWGTLMSIKSVSGEPVCMWLPQNLRKPNTSEYVQGAEVASDYDGDVPDGFDIIMLQPAKYLMFQGEPFAEEDYCEAIEAVQNAMDKYDPSVIGYNWDDSQPRIQLEPIGTRGYIELRAVK